MGSHDPRGQPPPRGQKNWPPRRNPSDQAKILQLPRKDSEDDDNQPEKSHKSPAFDAI
ncbi:uncharacterized protein BT62DRAFT_930917 [Guyanagaster necrorhizus]|uniref:Uncharacterized protein n=1 Tax=Guyanagaster necrorhizus TaxID=856835 RepID=A0A9P7VVU3_9AGAR|nr:uncharacterized protein BT62DRAFT_930917 [Guyanagaster necrorhizus MCA 3950]KAG7447879.1 hypothetical protein BT62DRAFT_930917 [Guyanagaster necrorhizus MCA 3950]